MILIVGLGNPGKKYTRTRHNIGKEIVQKFAEDFDFPKFSRRKARYKCAHTNKVLYNQKVILALPTTYMNESGLAVKKILTTYLPCRQRDNLQLTTNLWVIHDDIDLPLGKIRISKNAGPAGHKGVASIINTLGTKNFVRFRIGICATPEAAQLSVEKFVLRKFKRPERKIVTHIVKLTCEAISFALKEGLERTMNKYN